jgi:hypothetical protein
MKAMPSTLGADHEPLIVNHYRPLQAKADTVDDGAAEG